MVRAMAVSSTQASSRAVATATAKAPAPASTGVLALLLQNDLGEPLPPAPADLATRWQGSVLELSVAGGGRESVLALIVVENPRARGCAHGFQLRESTVEMRLHTGLVCASRPC